MKKTKCMKTVEKRKLVTMLMLILATVLMMLFCSYKLTFAWFSSDDERNNNFASTQLLAEIDEVFTSNQEWSPKGTTIKEVRVTNTGATDAFVRLSLYEFLLTLQVDTTDQTGNGNLRRVSAPITPEAQLNETSTWEQAAKQHGTFTQGSKHYVVETAIVPDPAKQQGMYPANRPPVTQGPLEYIKLNFSSFLQEKIPSEPSKAWVYEAGYFYYLQPLASGETSEPLLDSVTLSASYPNRYKGSLYKLKIYMDAHDLTEPLLEEWRISTTGSVYPVLKKQLK